MDRELPLGLRFSLLHRAFRKRMDALLREKDLTGAQFCVLGTLVRMEDGGAEEIHQKDLERASRVTHPTMTEIIKRLEKKEPLRCEPSLRDRRYKQIRSTDKCRSLGEQVRAMEEDATRWLCRGLCEEETRQLLAITDVMLRNAFEDCQEGGSRP